MATTDEAPAGRLARDHWAQVIAGLDPERDYEQISRIMARYEFPWDVQQALSFALFRTYAVPSIGRLLHRTGEFEERTQKRHDDTVLILDAALEHGLEDDGGRAAIRRMNQMHGAYDISNDDLRYVLSTFVVTPVRWIEAYGWRDGLPGERAAAVAYYRRLGALMGIRNVPQTYEEFADLMDAYEAEHFAYDDESRAVADATLDLLTTFYPRALAPAVRVFSISLMDEHLREAFGYRHPPRTVVAASRGALRLRGRLVRRLPARRRQKKAGELGIVRSYPDGYDVSTLGTFPPGCPVAHEARSAAPRTLS